MIDVIYTSHLTIQHFKLLIESFPLWLNKLSQKVFRGSSVTNEKHFHVYASKEHPFHLLCLQKTLRPKWHFTLSRDVKWSISPEWATSLNGMCRKIHSNGIQDMPNTLYYAGCYSPGPNPSTDTLETFRQERLSASSEYLCKMVSSKL